MAKRILVVEDNPDNMTLIVDVLTSLNYEIVQALNGQEGIDKAQEVEPDLILMDLALPLVDGWTATSRIKANPALKSTPVIALTAHALTGDREKALAAGCDDYLTKPLKLDRLIEKLTEYLET